MHGLIDFIRKINAAQNFKMEDDFEFIAFEDISAEHFKEQETVPDVLEIWAAIKLHFEGDLPESYKVLNLMIGDWVEEHVDLLTSSIHNELKNHFQQNYPESAVVNLDQVDDTAIWLDQLDYMPQVDLDNKTILVEVELVLDAEPIEE